MVDKKQLFKKFDNDKKKRSRFKRVALAFDQLFNVIFWNGSQDETISSHIGRLQAKGNATWFDKLVCNMLKKIENNHCLNSLGE